MEETNYDDSNNNNADDDHDDDNDTINEDHNNAENFDNAHHDNLGNNVNQDQTAIAAMDFDDFNLRGLREFDHSIFRAIEVIESSIVAVDANIALLDENMPPEIYQQMAENREMYIRYRDILLATFLSEAYEMDGDDFEDYDE